MGWVARALVRGNVEVALVQKDWVVRVFDVDVFVCDVVDTAVADAFAGPCFEACAVLFDISYSSPHIYIIFNWCCRECLPLR